MATKHFVVFGGTGQQGRAVIDALLENAVKSRVTAMVREPESPKALELKAKGVELVKGDLADYASMVKAVTGADGVYVVTVMVPFTEAGCVKETIQGKSAIAACKEAKVPFVVLSSVANSHLNTKIPHFESKMPIENDLKASGMQYCILKPACFMDNFATGAFSEPTQGTVQFLIDPDGTPLPFVACDDIGAFTCMALHSPTTFHTKEIELAGDLLTGNQLAAAFSKVRGGEPWKYSAAPLWLLQFFMRELSIMGYYFISPGMKVDLDECKKYRPLLTLEQWLIKKGYDKKQLKPASMCTIS